MDKDVKIINVTVRNKIPVAPEDAEIVCDNSDYVIVFDFDTPWDAYPAKTARFVYDQEGTLYHEDVPFSGNEVEVPKLINTTYVCVGVFAGDLVTTEPAGIRCRKSIRSGSGAPKPPTQDQYDQIMALINSGAVKGPPGPPGDDYVLTDADKQEIVGDVLAADDMQKVVADSAEAVERAAKAEELAKGMNMAKGFDSYAALIAELNDTPADTYKVGQSCLIVTLDVPDLWVSGIEEASEPYTYVDDTTVVALLQSVGYIRVGHYRLSMLETLKQDLSNYVKNTDYATNTRAGIVKIGDGVTVSSEGHVGVVRALPIDILAKKSMYSMLTPYTLDYAIKVGLTTNAESLTAEEQAAAQAWLGVGETIKAIPLDENGEYSCRIWELEDGIYHFPVGTMIYYSGNSSHSPSNYFRNTDGYLIITSQEVAEGPSKSWYAFGTEGYYGRTLLFGYTQETRGWQANLALRNLAEFNTINQEMKGMWTFSTQPKMTAALDAADDSTNIPNTAWVNAAIKAAVEAALAK